MKIRLRTFLVVIATLGLCAPSAGAAQRAYFSDAKTGPSSLIAGFNLTADGGIGTPAGTPMSAKGKLKAGKAKTLKLKLPGSGQADVAGAKTATARLKLTATDHAGDQFKAKQEIKLR